MRIKLPAIFFLWIFLLTFETWAQTLSKTEIERAISENRLALITDFDRTLTGPAWNAIWVVKKVPAVNNNALQLFTPTEAGVLDFNRLPMEIFLTENEFIDLYKYKMAIKENNGTYTVGNRSGVWLSQLPLPGREARQMFIPGFYMLNEDSFKFFRPSGGLSFLISDDETAKQSETGKKSRFGVTFPLFQELTLQGAENIHVVTARGQGPEEFLEALFPKWQMEGWIGSIMSPSGYAISVYPMGRGEGILYGSNLVEKKVRLARDQILTHYRLKATQSQQRHIIVLADDHPGIVKKYHDMLLELSAVSDYNRFLDFILVHADPSDEVVRRTGVPGRFVTYNNGFAEPLSEELVQRFFSSKKPQLIEQRFKKLSPRGGSCRSLFAKGGG